MNKISIKTPQEIEIMRKVGKLHVALLKDIYEYINTALESEKEISTYDIELRARETCDLLKVIPIQMGYRGYKHALCLGLNYNGPHAVPSKTAIVKNGDILTVDTTIKKDGFCVDGGFSMPIGEVDRKGLRLLKTAREALHNGSNACIEGNSVLHISNAIFNTVKFAGFDVLKDYIAHGIGKEMHEPPAIPNYPFRGQNPILKEGMTFAIETLVTEGKGRTKVMEDGWTTQTLDGKRFAFFENTVVVRKDKPEIINSLDWLIT